MTSLFDIQIVKASKKTGACSAYLLEDGSQVARVTRAANTYEANSRFCAPIEFKWFSQRAQARFCGLADTLSAAEIAEALGFPSPF